MRLIDADILSEQWTIASPEPYSTDAREVLESIKDAPTVDAVQVIRCKDCVKGRPWKNAWGSTGVVCDLLAADVSPNDFCSNGERKMQNGG